MTISVHEKDGRIALGGTLTEDLDLVPLAERLTGEVTIDLAGVRRINSAGVRKWMMFVRAVPAEVKLTLEKCSVPFVNQMNLVRDFVGAAHVASVYLPYLCPKCNFARTQLATLEDARTGKLPEPGKCDACGAALELDVDASHYLGFMNPPAPA